MGFAKFWMSRPEYFELRRDAKSYAELAAWTTDTNASAASTARSASPSPAPPPAWPVARGQNRCSGAGTLPDDEIPTSTETQVTTEPR